MQPGSRSILLAAALLVALAAPAALAQGRATRDAEALPRWQSLKSDNVNLRVGPGNQHPIEWVVRRRHLPVRVLAESDQWRKVRDSNGTEGWVSRALLSGARYGVVTGEIRALRRGPSTDAVAVARLEPGVIGKLLECRDAWCRMQAGGFQGWIARAEFWGTDPGENFR